MGFNSVYFCRQNESASNQRNGRRGDADVGNPTELVALKKIDADA